MIRRFVFTVALVAFTFAVAYSDDVNVRIFKVDGNKVTWKKTKFDKDAGKVVVEETAVTSTVTADAKVEKGVAVAKGKGGKGGKGAGKTEDLPEGLKNEIFTKIDDTKGVNATITTEDADGKGKITKIVVKGGGGGGKGKKAGGAN